MTYRKSSDRTTRAPSSKVKIVLALIALIALTSSIALSEYTDSEAWNVAQHFVTEALEERGCTKLAFAFIDYHVNTKDGRYAVYSDVKYVDSIFKNQRDYFVVFFDASDAGVELYFMTIGAEVYPTEAFVRDMGSR